MILNNLKKINNNNNFKKGNDHRILLNGRRNILWAIVPITLLKVSPCETEIRHSPNVKINLIN